MAVIDDTIAQFIIDALVVKDFANGGPTDVVQTANGPVRSLQKLIADGQLQIDGFIRDFLDLQITSSAAQIVQLHDIQRLMLNFQQTQ